MKLTITSAILSLCALPALHASTLPPEWEQAMVSYCELPAKLVPVLEQVTDTRTADEAAPKLHALLKDVYGVCTALQGIKSLSEAQAAEVRSRFEKQMREEWGKVFSQIYRLQQAQCFQSSRFNQQFQLLGMMLDQ